MKSRASFRSHPLHPMLIPFPIAFLVGALLADLGGYLLEGTDLHVVAWYLLAAGLAAGVIAALPGVVDYVYTVPPDSSARTRATRHALVNSSALLVFALAWWLRGSPGVVPEPVLLGLMAIGALLLGIGGWMGGTLVYRNQIGVDHRYAGAGRWSEVQVPGEPGSIAVADADELRSDQMKLVRAGGTRIVLARVGDGYVAFSDRCPHKGGSLAGGVLACGMVTCPWHGSQFDVASGALRAGPAESTLETFDVEVRGDKVYLTIPDGRGG
jgi:nitrite reductase/ring-hydroxylating ferredoxin subunit/uncharacterized membrane protein